MSMYRSDPRSLVLYRPRQTRYRWSNVGATAAALASMYYGRTQSKSLPLIKPKGGASAIPSRNIANYASKMKKKTKAKQLRKLKGSNLRKEVLYLKNQVRDLKHTENTGLADYTRRRIRSFKNLAAVGQQGIVGIQVNRTTEYETVLSNLKYYDITTNTFVTASGTAGTAQKEFSFPLVSSKILLRNNYQTDAQVIVYLCTPKQATSTGNLDAWTQGIADDIGNVSSFTEYGSLPTDYSTFNELYATKRLLTKDLSPGESCVGYHSVQDIMYDPAFIDSHSETHQKKLKNFSYLIIVRGLLGHDTAADEQGITPAGVDIQVTDTFKIKYDGGANFTWVDLDDTQDTPTNNFVQSHQPIPDNVQYSVS